LFHFSFHKRKRIKLFSPLSNLLFLPGFFPLITPALFAIFKKKTAKRDSNGGQRKFFFVPNGRGAKGISKKKRAQKKKKAFLNLACRFGLLRFALWGGGGALGKKAKTIFCRAPHRLLWGGGGGNPVVPFFLAGFFWPKKQKKNLAKGGGGKKGCRVNFLNS